MAHEPRPAVSDLDEQTCVDDEDRRVVLQHLEGTALGLVETLNLAQQRGKDAEARYLRAKRDLELELQRVTAFAGFVERYLQFVVRAKGGEVSDDELGAVSLQVQALTEGT